jgi:hypothetical protein
MAFRFSRIARDRAPAHPISLRATPRRQRQKGSAYLLAMFMVVLLILASEAAMENILTTGRRQREEELIWRGQQFVRAIRLYYRKTGHYPSTLDDLKKGMPELHFLRYAAYKDPMKTDDERAWRFIYVNAAGQIIGSVRYATLQQMAILDMNGGKIPGVKQPGQDDQPGVPVSALADQSASNSSAQNTQNSQNTSNNTQTAPNAQNPLNLPAGLGTPGLPSQTPPSSGTAPDNSSNATGSAQGSASSQNGANPQGASPTPTNNVGTPVAPGGMNGINGINTNLNNQSLAALAALKPTGPVDGPVLGGFLTGISSTVDKPSIRIYNGGKKYNQWEFIWNPIEDQAKAVQQGLNPVGTVAGQPGQSIGTGAAGTNPTSGFGPSASPGAGLGGSNSPNPNSPQGPNTQNPTPP